MRNILPDSIIDTHGIEVTSPVTNRRLHVGRAGPDPWLAPTIIVVYLLLIPVFAWVSHRNQYTRIVLMEGWTPVITAMLISR